MLPMLDRSMRSHKVIAEPCSSRLQQVLFSQIVLLIWLQSRQYTSQQSGTDQSLFFGKSEALMFFVFRVVRHTSRVTPTTQAAWMGGWLGGQVGRSGEAGGLPFRLPTPHLGKHHSPRSVNRSFWEDIGVGSWQPPTSFPRGGTPGERCP